jgi:hypothetical protein
MPGDAVPSHVRDLGDSFKGMDDTREKTDPGGVSVLPARLTEELHAETNPQKRPFRLDPSTQRLFPSLLPEQFHGREGKAPTPGRIDVHVVGVHVVGGGKDLAGRCKRRSAR